MTRVARALGTTLCVLLPCVLGAQEPPTLDRVEELTRLGRTEEARTSLVAWWESEARGASRRDVQRGLWLRGRLTVDPTQADLDFRRLVIEFPGGPWSDQALFRLAQSAYAVGDSAAAAAQIQRLSVEYPASPVRREAEAWLATAGPPPERPEGTAMPLGPAAGADPVVARAGEEPPGTPQPDTPPGEVVRPFAVQLGAFSSRDRAENLLRRVTEAGMEGRLVTIPGSDLVRVRVGAFDSTEGAGAILKRLQDLGFTAALARDAHREQRVR